MRIKKSRKYIYTFLFTMCCVRQVYISWTNHLPKKLFTGPRHSSEKLETNSKQENKSISSLVLFLLLNIIFI